MDTIGRLLCWPVDRQFAGDSVNCTAASPLHPPLHMRSVHLAFSSDMMWLMHLSLGYILEDDARVESSFLFF